MDRQTQENTMGKINELMNELFGINFTMGNFAFSLF